MAATRNALRRGLAALARANVRSHSGPIAGARACQGGVMSQAAIAGAAAREGAKLYRCVDNDWRKICRSPAVLNLERSALL